MGQEVSSNIHEHYTIRDKRLGKGTYGTVHKGVRKSDRKRVAVKVIKKKFIMKKNSLVEKLQREVLIMKQCKHHNIVDYYDVFVSKHFVFIVIEYCPGGDLLEFLNQRGRPLHEKIVSIYMKQALIGLKYLHSKGIVHRDIKPENLLLTADNQCIKIADFGLSHQTNPSPNPALFYTMCGSLTHIAPEVFSNNGYDHRVDIWAMGVVCFVMLSVSYPFSDPDRNKLIDMIIEGQLYFEETDDIWENVSLHAKDLIRLMLNVDPEQRLTLDQCMDHPFISGRMRPRRNRNQARSNTFAQSKKLASSRSMALFKAPDLNENDLAEVGFEQEEEEEEEEDRLAKQNAMVNARTNPSAFNMNLLDGIDEEEVEGDAGEADGDGAQ